MCVSVQARLNGCICGLNFSGPCCLLTIEIFFSYKRDYFKTLICQLIKEKQGDVVRKNLRVNIAILDWPKSVTKNNNAK